MTTNDFGRYHFQGQRPTENVLRIVHRHWFDIITHLLMVFIVIVLLFSSFSLIPLFFPDTFGQYSGILSLFFQSSLLLLVWLYGFMVWIDYFFDVWIITNERIINIEQKGLFVRTVSELKFSRIQDVTSEVSGMIPTILNFGDVKIQTASEEDMFLFRHVPDPYHIKDVIMERLRDDRDEEINRVAAAPKYQPGEGI